MDPVIKSHLLYQLSYTPIKYGASEGIRTLDHHLGKVELYQLSYTRFKRTGHNLSEALGTCNSKSRVFLSPPYLQQQAVDVLQIAVILCKLLMTCLT